MKVSGEWARPKKIHNAKTNNVVETCSCQNEEGTIMNEVCRDTVPSFPFPMSLSVVMMPDHRFPREYP